jgi:hypothetical protein
MGNNTPKKSRSAETHADLLLMEGLAKHEAALPSMVIGGKLRSSKDIATIVKTRVDASRAAVSNRAAWLASIQTEDETRVQTAALVSGLRKCVLVAFADQVDVLADFGLTPRKERVDTPEAKRVATERAKATRAARHTMGPKQKAAIKGEATGELRGPPLEP